MQLRSIAWVVSVSWLTACAGSTGSGPCGNGLVSQRSCVCGGATVTSGYCCNGAAQATACATARCGDGTCDPGETAQSCPADCPGACGNGAVSHSCTCGHAVVTSGYCCNGVAQATACTQCGDGICSSGETAQSCPADCAAGAIIADHTAAQRFSAIPARYLEAAKDLTLHYGHTSHGDQIVQGLLALESANAAYSVAWRKSTTEGLPPAEAAPALRIYDGTLGDTYVEPGDYWDSADGRGKTRTVAATGHYGFSMFAWCYQMGSASQTYVQSYLDTMDGFEAEFASSNVKFILMTGHTDGSDEPDGENTLKYNNRLIREHAIAHRKVLFDFADIESYDPAGKYYPETGNPDGACNWCESWCASNPADCAHLPGDCSHTHGLNCIQKAKAFWWLMARLAGWNGTDE